MSKRNTPGASGTLLSLTAMYALASLAHFVHNAVFIADYPNLPAWLSAAGVYGAWCVVSMFGIVGLCVYRRANVAGLTIIGLYALLGFAGLDHYIVAPVAAHSIAMNATILLEVATASALLAHVAWLALRKLKLRTQSLEC